MEVALRAALIAAGAMTSPSPYGERVYPVKLPQNATFPALTYQVISGPRQYTQDGKAQPTTFRVQVDVWDTSYNDVREIRDVLVWAISGARFDGIKRIFIDNERDLYEAALDAAGPQLFRKSLDLMVTADVY